MKSIYQKKKIAEYLDRRIGDEGEPYKKYILDPIMFRLTGDFKNKTVIELGCGNGYLAKKFVKSRVRKAILMDISKYNLEIARKKCDSKKIEYFCHDATKKWPINSGIIDIVYSNMMFNTVANIKTPIDEIFRILKKGGKFVFSVTHPAWDLYVYAQEKVGIKNEKYKNLGNYFTRKMTKYTMRINKDTHPNLPREFFAKFEVEHFQRPISDYFNQLIASGFIVNKIIEPELSKTFLKKFPRFREYENHPIGLIFHCIKR